MWPSFRQRDVTERRYVRWQWWQVQVQGPGVSGGGLRRQVRLVLGLSKSVDCGEKV